MNLHLISFGAPDKKYEHTRNRFYNEALNFQIFKSIKIFSDNDFDYYPELKEHENHCRSTPKIFGNGLWKWYLISRFMDELSENEIISYVDIGCTFNKLGLNRLYEYCEFTNQKGNLSFSLPYQEVRFTKMDTYRRIFPDSDEHLYTDHIMSGVIFIKNNSKNKKILNVRTLHWFIWM